MPPKKVVFIILSILLILMLIATTTVSWFFVSACGNQPFSELLSNDGRFKAVMFQRDCGGMTGFSTQISIIKADDTLCDNCAGNVFVADGSPEYNMLKLRWNPTRQTTKEHNLKIDIPNDLAIKTQNTTWWSWLNHVNITYNELNSYPKTCELDPQNKVCNFVSNDTNLNVTLAQFEQLSQHKALAVAIDDAHQVIYGFSYGYDSMLAAQRNALHECKKRLQSTQLQCQLVR